MNIRCSKDYETCHAISVEPLTYTWQHNTSILSYTIYNYNKDKFLKKWGKQTFCWVNYIGRRFYVWVHTLANCKLIILTHKEKGTCYEYVVTGDSRKVSKEIEDFIMRI